MDRGTVESRYDARVKELLEKNPEEAVEYMLRAVPLIKEYTLDEDSTQKEKTSHLDTFGFKVTATSSKNEVFCKYMAEVEDDYSFYDDKLPKKKAANRGHNQADWVCEGCGTTVFFDQPQAMMICPGCGLTKPFHEMNQHNLSFDEQVNMEISSHCCYKRTNHFVSCIESKQEEYLGLLCVQHEIFFTCRANGSILYRHGNPRSFPKTFWMRCAPNSRNNGRPPEQTSRPTESKPT